MTNIQNNLSIQHISVLSEAIENYLPTFDDAILVDCTAGGGGHTNILLKKALGVSKVFAIDKDPFAQETLTNRFSDEISAGKVKLFHNSFHSAIDDIQSEIEKTEPKRPIKVILADLGVSSFQLDSQTRGFSFKYDSPLDMRMDSSASFQAQDFINEAPEEEIARVIWEYGEEHFSRRIAKQIINKRNEAPITTTKQLVNIIVKAIPYQDSKKHVATKTFQALRIHVNSELEQLESLLEKGFNALSAGGIFAIITFHSLEDRLVKHFFQKKSSKKAPQPISIFELPNTSLYNKPEGTLIKPFPIYPSKEELEHNPRSRSAKLRLIQKI